MEFLQFWDQHRGSFSRISAAGGSYSYAPANKSWSGPFQNLGFGIPMSRICKTLSQIDSPRLLVWTDVIDLSQQSSEFLHFLFFTFSFIFHPSSSIIYHLIIYQASALIYHVIHHLSPSIYHLACIMYTSAFISHPFALRPQASGVIPELSALGPRPSARSAQPSPRPSSFRFQLPGRRPQASGFRPRDYDYDHDYDYDFDYGYDSDNGLISSSWGPQSC